jgi:hypothetical protein
VLIKRTGRLPCLRRGRDARPEEIHLDRATLLREGRQVEKEKQQHSDSREQEDLSTSGGWEREKSLGIEEECRVAGENILAKILQLSDAPVPLLCCYTNRRHIGHKVEAKNPALGIDMGAYEKRA